MTLEDHLGDIIRKARAMLNVSAEAAATAAGVTETEFATIEESGQVTQLISYSQLSKLLSLHPQKLHGIATGWLPAQKDLNIWREFRPVTTTAQGISVNCYLIWDEVSRDAALFDTGWDAQPILTLLAENQL